MSGWMPLALILLVTPRAELFAEANPHWEFAAESAKGVWGVALPRGSHLFNLGVDVRYLVGAGVQIGSTSNLMVVLPEGGGSQVALTMLFGPQFNFLNMADIRNDFFLGVGAGFGLANDTVNFIFGAQFGKRFQLTESISYRPHFALTSEPSSFTLLSFTPLAFSLLF